MKTVLFDLGGVLINWNDDWLYDEISSQIGKPFNEIKSKFNDNLCSLFESKINESEFWDIVLGSNNDIDKKRWSSGPCPLHLSRQRVRLHSFCCTVACYTTFRVLINKYMYRSQLLFFLKFGRKVELDIWEICLSCL